MHKIKSLSVGPIVGHTDVDHARIWGRGHYEMTSSGQPRRCFGVARLIGDGADDPVIFKMNPNFDMSGVAIFSNILPSTKYEFQIGYFFSDKELDEFSEEEWDWVGASKGSFSTASADYMASRNYVFGSCRYLLRIFGSDGWFGLDDRGDKTFRSILKHLERGEVDKLLMVGDQIYADDLNWLSPDKLLQEYLARYRDAFTQPHIRKLMSNLSTYMTLDDHEIEDNWPSNADPEDMMVKYPYAIHAYQTFQMSHSPLLKISEQGRFIGTPEHFYYTFSDGCCEFFVTDSRTERDPDDGEMLSEDQLEALLDWLNSGSDRVKMVVTSVPFFPDTAKANNDKWGGNNYRKQRDDIINHIQQNSIRKVVFLSGDVHCSMAAELNIGTESSGPLKIFSVISSAFYWPYPHMKRRQFKLQGHVASVADATAYPLGRVSDVYSSDNYTKLGVSPDRLNVEVFSRKGSLQHSINFGF